MNSKIGRFFYLTTRLVLGIFLLLIGLYGVLISWFSFLQMQLIELITQHTLILSLFGLGVALIGVSILVHAILQSKRHYYHIYVGKALATVDENLIQGYLHHYWQQQFPHHSIPSHLTIKKKSIHILVDLPFVPPEKQKAFLDQVEKDFTILFDRLLGYPYAVYLNASFQSD